VGVGAAGALADPEAAQVLAERLCAALPADRVTVASDATTSHVGALGGGAGVTLAIGTGAVAIAVGPSGEMRRSDGWGPWLGDEGGGAWIGVQGLRAALRAHDGRGNPTILAGAAEARFGPIESLASRMESSGSPPRLAARFAADVAAAAEAGDGAAIAIMAQACQALASAVRAVAPAEAVRLAVIGGLAKLEAGLVRPLLAALGPSVSPVAPLGTALDGARRLALDAGTVHELAVRRATAAQDASHGLDLLATEGRRAGLEDLDLRSPGDIVRLVLAAERDAQDALARACDQLAAAADAIAARMQAGGRLFTLGAGTPGRLAVLDAAELAPTYSAPPGLVIALLAGGPAAMLEAAEGAEDDRAAAAVAMDARGLGPGDAVVGIAASGRTPYVVGGLAHARSRGALTVAIVNNPGSPAAAAAELAVEILTGAEIVAGSTRMTAGTTQKIALNALSTAAMVALGKTYGAWMVDVRATNDKLRRRALRIVQEITGAPPEAAAAALEAGGGSVKQAVVALLAGVDAAEAADRLTRSGGRVRDAVRPSA
jgi:N-acetylmuramic acid 6-phosphate etherase